MDSWEKGTLWEVSRSTGNEPLEDIPLVVLISTLLQSPSLTPPTHPLSSYAEMGGVSPEQAPTIATSMTKHNRKALNRN